MVSTHHSGSGVTCADGCWIGTESLSALLDRKGISHFRAADGSLRSFSLYFDDWYLYRVPAGTWGLWKMREQEQDGGDSDEPGMTVAFVALDLSVLETVTAQTADALAAELQRVVGDPGQHHDENLRKYFLRPEAEGPYRMGLLYIQKLAALAEKGRLALPRRFSHASRRLRRFLEETGVVRGGEILLKDPAQLSGQEQLALLASHTGNTSLDSLAAEIRFHAAFLRPKLPGVYASALRADMIVLKQEFLPLMPYYNENSPWVKAQRKAHPQYR